MSVYFLNKVFYLLGNDPSFRERYKEDFDRALEGFRLTAAEREALRQADVQTLYRMGVHPFLLFHLIRHRLCPLSPQEYLRLLQEVASVG